LEALYSSDVAMDKARALANFHAQVRFWNAFESALLMNRCSRHLSLWLPCHSLIESCRCTIATSSVRSSWCSCKTDPCSDYTEEVIKHRTQLCRIQYGAKQIKRTVR
jgi:hypothetical protein